jgi:2-oxo-4-hydroxy-4-carboxy-5-ureidoimidazoline decarboxylase
MIRPQLTLEQINALDREGFTAALGFVFEGPPWIQRRAWEQRPFPTVANLHAALVEAMLAADQEQKLALIRAHPDLAGRAAIAGELTAESTSEQSSAGLDRLTPAEYAEFHRLNAAYRERFGLPFVICAREHNKTSILAQFAARLQNAPAREVETALGEIAKIAGLRLRDAVSP